MSEKHTPGPWHTSPLYYSDIPENVRVVICAAPKSIQHAHTKVGEAAFSPERSDYYVCNRDEAEANARLMAAAPKALVLARYAVDNPDFDSAVFDHMAREFIAEATGETP